MKIPEFIVLSKSKTIPSMKTNGYYFTIIARELESGKCYKVWADTTFSSYDSWNVLHEGDIFTNVEIINEPRKLLSAVNQPRKIIKKENTKLIQLSMNMI